MEFGGLDEERNERAGKAAEVVEHEHRAVPAKRQTSGSSVYYHQAEINDERGRQAASGKGKMRATIKNYGSEGADGEFDHEERQFAVCENARH